MTEPTIPDRIKPDNNQPTAGGRHCKTCGAHLDVCHDPFSMDCGGDCLLCMADAGDPDCLKSVLDWCRDTFRKIAMIDADIQANGFDNLESFKGLSREERLKVLRDD